MKARSLILPAVAATAFVAQFAQATVDINQCRDVMRNVVLHCAQESACYGSHCFENTSVLKDQGQSLVYDADASVLNHPAIRRCMDDALVSMHPTGASVIGGYYGGLWFNEATNEHVSKLITRLLEVSISTHICQ